MAVSNPTGSTNQQKKLSVIRYYDSQSGILTCGDHLGPSSYDVALLYFSESSTSSAL